MTTNTATAIRAAAYATGYTDGYRWALADILTALEDGGEDAVREWIANNYNETEAGRP